MSRLPPEPPARGLRKQPFDTYTTMGALDGLFYNSPAGKLTAPARALHVEGATPVKSTILSQILQIAAESRKHLPPLTDDLVLVHSGLDSLAVAILVTRLEDLLGIDPFNEPDGNSYPVTLGDFIRFYENAAR
jgi:acyl carrier protein